MVGEGRRVVGEGRGNEVNEKGGCEGGCGW